MPNLRGRTKLITILDDHSFVAGSKHKHSHHVRRVYKHVLKKIKHAIKRSTTPEKKKHYKEMLKRHVHGVGSNIWHSHLKDALGDLGKAMLLKPLVGNYHGGRYMNAGQVLAGELVKASAMSNDASAATILALELEDSVKENSDKVQQTIEDVTVEKMEHYITRGIQEVAQCIEDLNFETDGILEDKGSKINGISLNDDGSCVVKLTRTLTVSDPNKIDLVSSKSRTFSIPDRFAKYVKWSITMPQNIMAPFVTVSCEVTIPSDMVSSMIGGGDPNEEYKKSISEVEKFAKDLVKEL